MAKIKFKDMSKKDKIFKIVNLCIMAAFIAITLGIGIYKGAIGQTKRLLAGFAIACFFLIPYLFELIFRTRISNVLFLGIEIYLLFAGLLGSMVGLYDYLSWYDVVVHISMGYLVAMLGIFIFSRLTEYKKLNPIAIAFFCLFFSLAVELVWEICEYIVDLSLGLKMQGEKIAIDEYNNLVPAVSDTIIDLCCNFSGALVFFLHFVLGKYTKRSLGVKTIEEELAKGMKSVEILPQRVDLTGIQADLKSNKKYIKNKAKICNLKFNR